MPKWLRKDVGRIINPRDMRDGDETTCNMVADPMESTMDVLHGGLVLRVLGDLDCRLVIHENGRGSRHVIAETFKKVVCPHYLTAHFREGSVL